MVSVYIEYAVTDRYTWSTRLGRRLWHLCCPVVMIGAGKLIAHLLETMLKHIADRHFLLVD